MNAFGLSALTRDAAAVAGLRMAIEAMPADKLENALLSILPDLVAGPDLERIGDRLARAGHMGARG